MKKTTLIIPVILILIFGLALTVQSQEEASIKKVKSEQELKKELAIEAARAYVIKHRRTTGTFNFDTGNGVMRLRKLDFAPGVKVNKEKRLYTVVGDFSEINTKEDIKLDFIVKDLTDFFVIDVKVHQEKGSSKGSDKGSSKDINKGLAHDMPEGSDEGSPKEDPKTSPAEEQKGSMKGSPDG